MDTERTKRIQKFCASLELSNERQADLKKASNEELADLLVEKVWSEYPILSFEFDLIDEVINRLDPLFEKRLDEIYGKVG